MNEEVDYKYTPSGHYGETYITRIEVNGEMRAELEKMQRLFNALEKSFGDFSQKETKLDNNLMEFLLS